MVSPHGALLVPPPAASAHVLSVMEVDLEQDAGQGRRIVYDGITRDELILESEKHLQNRILAGKSYSTLNKLLEARRFYESNVGGNFFNDDGTTIIRSTMAHLVQDTTTRKSKKRSLLRAISSLVDSDIRKTVTDTVSVDLRQMLQILQNAHNPRAPPFNWPPPPPGTLQAPPAASTHELSVTEADLEESKSDFAVCDEYYFDDPLLEAEALNRNNLPMGTSIFGLSKWEKAKLFYDSIVGGNLLTDKGSDIIMRTIVHVQRDTKTRASTKRGRLLTISSMVDRDTEKAVDERISLHLRKMLKLLYKEGRKDRAREYHSNPRRGLTYKDTHHMMSCFMIAADDRVIPTPYLEFLHFVLAGQVTGKRGLERNLIAATSWRLTVRKLENGQVVRWLTFSHCYMNHFGPGIYNANLEELLPVQKNFVVMSLGLLQRKVMIASALDVYEGRTVLAIDESRFETAADLLTKVQEAERKATPELIRCLTEGENTDSSRNAVNT